MERRKNSGRVRSRLRLESVLFFGFFSLRPPSRTSSLSHAAVPGPLALYVFNGCLPNQAFTAGNFSAPHCVRRRRAPFLAGLSAVPGCLVLAREKGRWGGWGCGVGPVPTLQLCSFFSFSDKSEFNQATEKPIMAEVSRHSSGLSSLKSLLFVSLLSRFLRFYSVFSCVSVSEAAFFFLSLVSALFLSLPLLISHSLFCQISSTLCKAFLFTLLYPISPLAFLFSLHSTPKTVVWWSSGWIGIIFAVLCRLPGPILL